jgi:hypothetical protein
MSRSSHARRDSPWTGRAVPYAPAAGIVAPRQPGAIRLHPSRNGSIRRSPIGHGAVGSAVTATGAGASFRPPHAAGDGTGRLGRLRCGDAPAGLGMPGRTAGSRGAVTSAAGARRRAGNHRRRQGFPSRRRTGRRTVRHPVQRSWPHCRSATTARLAIGLIGRPGRRSRLAAGGPDRRRPSRARRPR